MPFTSTVSDDNSSIDPTSPTNKNKFKQRSTTIRLDKPTKLIDNFTNPIRMQPLSTKNLAYGRQGTVSNQIVQEEDSELSDSLKTDLSGDDDS